MALKQPKTEKKKRGRKNDNGIQGGKLQNWSRQNKGPWDWARRH